MTYDGHGVKISLLQVSGATCEAGGQHCSSSANVAGVITSLQGIAETTALVAAQVGVMVSLILQSLMLNLACIVHNPLLEQPSTQVKHATPW